MTALKKTPTTPKRKLWTNSQVKKSTPMAESDQMYRITHAHDGFSPEQLPQAQLIQFKNPDEINFNFDQFLTQAQDEIQDNNQNPQNHQFAQLINDIYPFFVSSNSPPMSPSGNYSCIQCGNSNCQLASCTDCFNENLFCSACLCSRHINSHFHRIWNFNKSKNCFFPSSLTDHGYTTFICHENGSICNCPGDTQDFTVLHTNGVHKLKIHQCKCDPNSCAKITIHQLLANRLFPHSWTSPSTLYTHQLMDTHHFNNIKAFVNIKQQCDIVLALTPPGLLNTSSPTLSSGSLRSQFHYNMRLYRLIKSMLHAGAQNYEDFLSLGVAAQCPACPHPDINLPEDWQKRKHSYAHNPSFHFNH